MKELLHRYYNRSIRHRMKRVKYYLKKNKTPAISIVMAIISVVSMGFSINAANRAHNFNIKMNEPSASLIEVSVNKYKSSEKLIDIDFHLIMKNVGGQTMKISDLSYGFYDNKKNKFEIASKDKSIVNPIHKDGVFYQLIKFHIMIDDASLPQEEVNNYVSNYFSKDNHKIVIVYKIKYRGVELESSKEKEEIYYLGFNGKQEVSQIYNTEYKEIVNELPLDFRSN